MGNWMKRFWKGLCGGHRALRGTCAAGTIAAVVMASIMLTGNVQTVRAAEIAKVDVVPREPSEALYRFPTVPAEHRHARALLENSLRYVAPQSHTIDPASGYPVEGWNNEPATGLCLRCFTQLTAIGLWMELLGTVIVGDVEVPYLTREQAMAQLAQVIQSLRHDQRDPQVGAKGLLGNFLDLASGRRLGLLASDVERQRFYTAFGPEKGEAIWQALKAKGWLFALAGDREASIVRSVNYGWNFFDGPLAPFADEPTRRQIMAILDQRVVMIVFGDNANLSTSVAKTIGALLAPAVKSDPRVVRLREEMEQFLEDQREGYAYLYDDEVGLFHFGWDVAKNRQFGWADGQGRWQAGYMDYLVNEFRGPSMFVVARYDFPTTPLKHLGFKMKPYALPDGTDLYALAPWEGSAFQALGLGLSMMELERPSWRKLLENVVQIELDYATRQRIPGFLSESYTGHGAQYTGDVGIPEIAVSTSPRITESASLYTLGVAYMVSPAKVEEFLARNWPAISRLLTDHGPWEGYNTAKQETIQIQTSAHTLSLILGLLGTGSDYMQRYLEFKGVAHRIAEVYPSGEEVDLLSEETQVFAWADKPSTVQSSRAGNAFQVTADRVARLNVAFVPAKPEGVKLGGGLLSIRYRSTEPIDRAAIELKSDNGGANGRVIPTEIFTRLADTEGREVELQVPLPSTPGLTAIKEIVLTCTSESEACPVDLVITGFEFTPYPR